MIIIFVIFVRVDTWIAFPGSTVVTDPVNVDAGILIVSGTVITAPLVKTTFKLKLTIVGTGIPKL